MGISPAQASGPVKVVAAFLDGRRLKGFAFDFSAFRDKCRIFPSEKASAGEGQEIHIQELKALFFVKEFADAGHHELTHSHEFVGVVHGRKIEVVFGDGERLTGATEGYNPKRLGFFVVPANTGGNNLRVFVVNANVQQVRWL